MEKIIVYFVNNPYLCIALFIIFLILTATLMWKRRRKYIIEEMEDIPFDFVPTPIDEYGEKVSFLNERVAEMFKLKNSLFKFPDLEPLLLKRKEQYLLGYYAKMGVYLLYCEDIEESSVITIEKQKEIEKRMQNLVEDMKRKAHYNHIENWNVTAYYIITKGKFEKNANSTIKWFQEDDFITYLIREEFEKYANEVLIGNCNKISKITGKSLNKTFISPKKEDQLLETYLDNWLVEESNKQIIITGDYGMGKTSFITYYASVLGKQILEKFRKNEPIERFPIVVNLKNLNSVALSDKIGATLSSDLGISSHLFDKLVQKGKIVFLLDGFDEMGFGGKSNESKVKSFDAIWSKLATKNNKIIITGRTRYFENEVMKTEFLRIKETRTAPYGEEIKLQSLKEAEIYNYLTKWYPKNAKKYMAWLKEAQRKSLYDLCSRPYFTSLIALDMEEIYSQKEKKEWTGVALMDKWIERQIDKNIQGGTQKKDSYRRDLIWLFFKELAVELYIKDCTSMPTEFFNEYLKNFVDSKMTKRNIDEKMAFASELRTGYFLQDDEDEWTFAHKPIYEYLIARKIMELLVDKKGSLKHPILSKKWTPEISAFVDDMIPIKFREEEKEYGIPALLLMVNGYKSEFTAKMYRYYTSDWGSVLFLTMIYVLITIVFGVLIWIICSNLNLINQPLYALALPSIIYFVLFTTNLFLRLFIDNPEGIVSTAFSIFSKKEREDFKHENGLGSFAFSFLFVFFGIGIASLIISNATTIDMSNNLTYFSAFISGLIFLILFFKEKPEIGEWFGIGSSFLIAWGFIYISVVGINQLYSHSHTPLKAEFKKIQYSFSGGRGGRSGSRSIEYKAKVDTTLFSLNSVNLKIDLLPNGYNLKDGDSIYINKCYGLLGFPLYEPIYK